MRRLSLALCIAAACTPVGEAPEPVEVTPAEVAPAEPPTPEHEDATAPAPAPEPLPRAPAPIACSGEPIPALPTHPGLALELKSNTRGRVEPGQPIELVPSIRNASKTDHHAAVLSGDGSEVGWREPHLWYSGFVDSGDGCWTPLPARDLARCGMYDEDWRDEVVDLAPGASAELQWLPSPTATLDIPPEGRVRIFVHYAYRAGKTHRGGVDGEQADLGAMKGVEAFELVSNPVEFELRQPPARRPRSG